MSRKSVIVTGLVAGIVGMGIGGAAGTETEPAAAEPKTEVVTKTETITEEVEVEVEVAAPACLEALDHADDGFGIAGKFANASGEVMGLAQEGFMAMAQNDLATIQTLPVRIGNVNDKMDAINAEMGGLVGKYTSARDECRSAS